MKIIPIFTVGIAGLLSAAPAQAQNARSFVSGHGSDSAACTLPAPCRTLAQALIKTNAGGEIDILDPAGYGSLTIDKAISIVNDGVGTAGVIVPNSGVGITINAGSNDAVSLRGLSIEGGGVGAVGILFNTGASLTVEDCVIRHVSVNGISFFPTAASSLSIANTLVADVGFHGIIVLPSGSSSVTATFNRVRVNNNGGDGIQVSGLGSPGTVKASVYDSFASRNDNGFFSTTTSGKAPTTLTLFHSVSSNNATGLRTSGSGATLRVSHSMVTGNTNGWTVSSSGVLLSDGDNTIEGNASNETAPPTYARK